VPHTHTDGPELRRCLRRCEQGASKGWHRSSHFQVNLVWHRSSHFQVNLVWHRSSHIIFSQCLVQNYNGLVAGELNGSPRGRSTTQQSHERSNAEAASIPIAARIHIAALSLHIGLSCSSQIPQPPPVRVNPSPLPKLTLNPPPLLLLLNLPSMHTLQRNLQIQVLQRVPNVVE